MSDKEWFGIWPFIGGLFPYSVTGDRQMALIQYQFNKYLHPHRRRRRSAAAVWVLCCVRINCVRITLHNTYTYVKGKKSSSILRILIWLVSFQVQPQGVFHLMLLVTLLRWQQLTHHISRTARLRPANLFCFIY